MFAALKRLTDTAADGVSLTPKFLLLNRNWTKAMQTLETKIQTLQTELEVADLAHADACLLAEDGGPDGADARDKARAKSEELGRALVDARAAHVAANRRKGVDDQKAKAKTLAARLKRVAAIHKDVTASCDELDDLLDQVAARAITLRDQTNALRLEGVREAQTPLVNLDRALGSRLRWTGIPCGTHHPFDESTLKLADLCVDLATTISASEAHARRVGQAEEVA